MGTNGTLATTSALNFHGAVVTSDVSISITSQTGDFGQWNLIGNPYASYITLADFLAENNSEFDVAASGIYGYDGDASDGWVIWNQAFSDANSGTLITPGQGFFVASKSGGGTVDFKTTMRSIGSTDDFILGRSTNTNHLGDFKLNLTSNSSSYHTDFYFNLNASSGLDAGYDNQIFGNNAPAFSIYSQLADGSYADDQFAIQSLGAAELTNVTIPLGVNVPQGEQATISLLGFNLTDTTEVYLEDTLENTFTLLNTTDYIFTPNETISGVGRFFLQVSTEALSINDNESETIDIYSINKKVIIKGILHSYMSLKLYDVQGRVVKSTELSTENNTHIIDVENLTNGIYIVSLEGEYQNTTQKVVIKD